jgi:HD-like signal output (HDOD) protein
MTMTLSTDTSISPQFVEALRDNGIPPCPAVLEQIDIEMQREEPDLRRLSDMICSDVGLAAGLIKTANSPYFGTRQRVASIMEALMILGLDTASQAIACVALHQVFPNLRHLERFWDSSARIARLSGWLAQQKHWPGIRPPETYTFALFRDCGIAVLLQRFPDYEKVLKSANNDGERCFTAIEDDVLPTNHAVVGAMLAQSWWLPTTVCDAIRYHHDLIILTESNQDLPSTSSNPAQLMAAIAQLAEFLLQENTGHCQTREWQKLGNSCLRQLSLTKEHMADLSLRARDILAERH